MKTEMKERILGLYDGFTAEDWSTEKLLQFITDVSGAQYDEVVDVVTKNRMKAVSHE